MARSRYLNEILTLDPLVDHQRIVYLDSCCEFPWDTTRALEFALFRTYAVPSIGRLLDTTGEFHARPQKRYDDTDIIISMMLENGYESPSGRAALRKMNSFHGRFDISNDDLLYVLSTFIFEPIRWNEKFGWRLMVEQERLGAFHCWSAIGRRMNIKEIPERYDELERFNVEYERTNFRYSPESARVGRATTDLFLSWFPRIVRPMARLGIYAMLDGSLRRSFGFPDPPGFVKPLGEGALKARARLLRLFPDRKSPRLRTQLKRRRAYPAGYDLEDLGPPAAG